jgi:dimeric dUTPase (all-alpha-NTP-PPase superfamily)
MAEIRKLLENEYSDEMHHLQSWGMATKMQDIYKDAKKSVSGNAEQRRIARMKIVLEAFLDELKEAVERAEQESV